jgi:hypothetical protein
MGIEGTEKELDTNQRLQQHPRKGIYSQRRAAVSPM